MSTYPSVELVLRETGGDRARARDLIRSAILQQAHEEAHEEAVRAGLSINCRADLWRPAGDHRCKNDGSSCICVCHDDVQQEASRR